MKQTTVRIDNVIYNAASQSFEALVAVSSAGRTYKYPCAIDAPITMSFEQAARGLETQALRRHKSRTGMYSQMRRHMARVRAGRQGFDPRTWLAHLGLTSTGKAA